MESENKLSEDKNISRRNYLKYVAGGVVAVAVAGGAGYYLMQSGAPPTPTQTTTEAPMTTAQATTSAGWVLTGATSAERAINAAKHYMELHNIPAGYKIVAAIPPPARGQWGGDDPTKYIKDFVNATGLTVEAIDMPIEQVRSKLTAEATAKSGAVDLYQIIPASWVADFAEMGLAQQLDDWVTKYDPEFDHGPNRIIPTKMANENKYNGHWYASTLDYDVWFLNYRSDVMEDPKEMDNFKSQYGYDLKPPTTWAQLYDQCEFFHRPKANPPLYGWWTLKNPVWELIEYKERLASRGVFYFDDDMHPLINSDPAIEALQDEVALQKFLAPESYTGFWDQMFDFFWKKKIVMCSSWTSLKHFGYSQGVGDLTKGALNPGYATKDGTVRSAGMLALDNSIFVNANGKNPELAYLFMQYYLDADVSAKWLLDPGGWYEMFRLSHFDATKYPEITKIWGADYSAIMLENAADWFVPDFTMQGSTRYDDALDKQLNAVLKGAADPKKAMDSVAVEWEKITDELGRDKQKAVWADIKAHQYGAKLRPLMDPNL
jgi:multiple sugar transport system substrate-binding protein